MNPSSTQTTVDIPITAARQIAERYGYHQIVIIGRAVGEDGREHVTTYGIDKPNCEVAARIGNFLKRDIMGWPEWKDAAHGRQRVRPIK